jgi:HAD superfamily hydrolase (TIGR01549 family)
MSCVVGTDVRAVFFDLGGTLFSNVQIPRVCTPVLEAAAERLGLEGGLAGIGGAFVAATQRVNAAYLKQPYYLHRDLFVDTGRELLRNLGREDDTDFCDWFYVAQRDVMIEQIELREDCHDTLAVLRERGFLLSVVSNIDHDFLDPMIVNFEIEPLFDHFVSSETVQSCKPDAGIFRAALDRVECRPDEVVFVGDSRIHDIQGASGVGIRSVLINERGGVSHLDDEEFHVEPDHVIGSLSDLLELDVLQGGRSE